MVDCQIVLIGTTLQPLFNVSHCSLFTVRSEFHLSELEWIATSPVIPKDISGRTRTLSAAVDSVQVAPGTITVPPGSFVKLRTMQC
jgi:hypothetical protein